MPLMTSGASMIAPLMGLGLVLDVGMDRGSGAVDARGADAGRRITGLRRCVLAAFALVLIRYWHLQIVQHERFLRIDLERDYCYLSVLC